MFARSCVGLDKRSAPFALYRMLLPYLLLAAFCPLSLSQSPKGTPTSLPKPPASNYPARYGPGFNIGPTSNEIIRSETTYTPGPLEQDAPSLLFLWPGLIDNAVWGKGDLIQTVIEGSKYNRYTCGAKPGQWCLAPYVMHGIYYADSSKQVAIDPDARIRIIYAKTADGKSWTQTTVDLKTGTTLHNYTKGTGKMTQ